MHVLRHRCLLHSHGWYPFPTSLRSLSMLLFPLTGVWSTAAAAAAAAAASSQQPAASSSQQPAASSSNSSCQQPAASSKQQQQQQQQQNRHGAHEEEKRSRKENAPKSKTGIARLIPKLFGGQGNLKSSVRTSMTLFREGKMRAHASTQQ